MRRIFEINVKYTNLLNAIEEEKRKSKGKVSIELSRLKKEEKHENDTFDLEL
jgi:hypothetical protein